MSPLMTVAIVGMLLGLACILVGFFKEMADTRRGVPPAPARRARAARRRPLMRRKAA